MSISNKLIKISSICAILLTVSACADLPWTPAPYDSGEMLIVSKIKMQTAQLPDDCNGDVSFMPVALKDLDFNIDWLIAYSSALPKNDGLVKMEKDMKSMVHVFATKYDNNQHPSTLYCTEKSKNVSDAIEEVIRVIQHKAK